MPDTAGSPGHQFRLTAREVGLCDESSHAGNKRDPKAAESTALGGRRVCVSARVPSRPWRPATAPGLAPFNRAAKKLLIWALTTLLGRQPLDLVAHRDEPHRLTRIF